MFDFKKLLMLRSTENKEVDVIKTWRVTWKSRKDDGYGQYGAVREEIEIFTSDTLANEFAEQLRAAFKFVRQRVQTEVYVTPNQ